MRLSGARIRFLLVIELTEVFWALGCGAACRVSFHGLPGSFNVVRGNLRSQFCWVVSVPVFLPEFH